MILPLDPQLVKVTAEVLAPALPETTEVIMLLDVDVVPPLANPLHRTE